MVPNLDTKHKIIFRGGRYGKRSRVCCIEIAWDWSDYNFIDRIDEFVVKGDDEADDD